MFSALEIFFVMRYINLLFTYLLTYLLTYQNADWLSAYGRTAKIGFDPIATERQLRRNGRWQRRNGIFTYAT